jgi:transcriptional regulator with XRE-family HTH domain
MQPNVANRAWSCHSDAPQWCTAIVMTTDRETGARLLRQLRERRGWSWADLARALRDTARHLGMTSPMNQQVSSIQRTVARWESVSERTRPGERYQLLLAHLYARTPAGDLAFGPSSDFAALLEALRHYGTPPQRVRQLAEMIIQSLNGEGRELLTFLPLECRSTVIAVHRDPSRLDPDVLSHLRKTVAVINGQIGSTPFVRLQLQLAPIIAACRRLLRHDAVGPRDGLTLLATTAYALAARLAFETRDDETALALYAEAIAVAGRLTDRSHRAVVETSHTMVTLHATSDPRAARKIAHAATIDAHRGASYAIRARAHAVHAEVCARAGQASEAAAALDRAWKTVDQLTVDDPQPGFDAHRLNGFDGLCALYAGDAGRAHDNLERSLAALKMSRDAVQRGIVSTDLALARLRLGDPMACVDLLHEAVDIAAATGGRVTAQRIRLVRQALRPWRAEAFLTELDDHIHATLIGG